MKSIIKLDSESSSARATPQNLPRKKRVCFDDMVLIDCDEVESFLDLEEDSIVMKK